VTHTRFLIRARSDTGWSEMGKYLMGERLQDLLQESLRAGKLVVREPGLQAVAEIKVFEADLPAPPNPVQAILQGFYQEENPFPLGTKGYRSWAKKFAEAAKWVRDYDDR
jgi:hypothetical protein